ncbi:MAG TPA: RNA polymerase sigma factor [Candidatus Eisenbacteria bacterium]|jgi:RNA polymerase sigma-70 factor (ECF subfamily)
MSATLTWHPTLTLEQPALSQTLVTSDVALAVRGDAQAFGRLYEENVGRVHALARRMVGYEHARELTQDVFVRAWQKLHTFRGDARFSTWLHRLAVNLILSRRAAFATERARFLGDDEVLDRIESRPAGREHAIDFEGAIGRLPEGARMIFVLHDVEGYRHEEIAALLGVTTGTTKAQLHRARMLLRGHLGA